MFSFINKQQINLIYRFSNLLGLRIPITEPIAHFQCSLCATRNKNKVIVCKLDFKSLNFQIEKLSPFLDCLTGDFDIITPEIIQSFLLSKERKDLI